MRALFLSILLGACVTTGDTPVDGSGRNGLGLRLVVEGAPEVVEDTGDEPPSYLEEVTLSLDEVRFVGTGRDGPVETTDGTSVLVELVTGRGLTDLPTLSLPEDTYTAARYELVLDGKAAMVVRGRVEDEAFRVEIPGPLVWSAEAASFLLPDGPDPQVTFTIHPFDWVDAIDVGDAEPDGEGEYVFSPTSNPVLYAEIVAEMMDGIEGQFPEGLEDADP